MNTMCHPDKRTDVLLNEGYTSGNGQPVLVRGMGAEVFDDQGRAYLDTAMGGGSVMLGHADPVLVETIQQRIANGTIFTAPCQEALDYADYLRELMPRHSGFVFSSTGSEATLRAIRLARAYTGRDRVAMFSGGWHGSHDQVLFEEHPESTESEPVALQKSMGIPRDVAKQVLFLPYNHTRAVDLIAHHAKDLALVLVEPTQGSNPRDDISTFLQSVADICRHHGVVFGMDEVITGGRFGLGGGQDYYGVEADIATYGKTLGGGFPIGVLGVNRELGNTIREGVFMGGTFSGNPVSTLAGHTVMETLAAQKDQVYPRLEQAGLRIRREISQYCQSKGYPAHVIGAASMFRLIFSGLPVRSRHDRDRKEIALIKQERFYQILMRSGIYVGKNRINFLSVAHNGACVSRLIGAYQEALGSFFSGNIEE